MTNIIHEKCQYFATILICSCINGFSSPFCHSRCYQYKQTIFSWNTSQQKLLQFASFSVFFFFFGSLWKNGGETARKEMRKRDSGKIGKNVCPYILGIGIEIQSNMRISFSMYVQPNRMNYELMFLHSYTQTIDNHIATWFRHTAQFQNPSFQKL